MDRMSVENRKNVNKVQQELAKQRSAKEFHSIDETQSTELEKSDKMEDQLKQPNDDVDRSVIESEEQGFRSKNDAILDGISTAGRTGGTMGNEKRQPTHRWVKNYIKIDPTDGTLGKEKRKQIQEWINNSFQHYPTPRSGLAPKDN